MNGPAKEKKNWTWLSALRWSVTFMQTHIPAGRNALFILMTKRKAQMLTYMTLFYKILSHSLRNSWSVVSAFLFSGQRWKLQY